MGTLLAQVQNSGIREIISVQFPFRMLWLIIIAFYCITAEEGEAACQAAVHQIYNTYGAQDSKLRKCRDRIRKGHRGFVLFSNRLPLQGALSECKFISIFNLIFRYSMFFSSSTLSRYPRTIPPNEHPYWPVHAKNRRPRISKTCRRLHLVQ